MYGRIEASIESLEPAEKDLLGCAGSLFFFLKTAGRKGRADFLSIIASKVFAKEDLDGGSLRSPSKASGFFI